MRPLPKEVSVHLKTFNKRSKHSKMLFRKNEVHKVCETKDLNRIFRF